MFRCCHRSKTVEPLAQVNYEDLLDATGLKYDQKWKLFVHLDDFKIIG